MNPLIESAQLLTRRHFCGRTATGIGTAALAALLNAGTVKARAGASALPVGQRLPHFAPRAKRVIYLFMAGGPSQMDLLDYKPQLRRLHGSELPESVRHGQRLTGMTSGQDRFAIVNPGVGFQQRGGCGSWVSDLLPHIGGIVDDICIIKSATTEAINHDPAITFMQTGAQQPGRPCLGAWMAYGLGSGNANLPAFVVMVSSGLFSDQPLFTRLWNAGFLPSEYQGVQFRGKGDPVLYLSNPPGVTAAGRRRTLDALAQLNGRHEEAFGDPEINARTAQYEMAFRMQSSVPELADISGESASTLALYGPDVHVPGSYAANCLRARRMAERGVNFIQLYHRGWDQHTDLPTRLARQCRDTDQASAGLILDLKQRGLLDDTLVIWGGEFGRTVYAQGDIKSSSFGRDHHGRCFSLWMAGGGIQGGRTYGETDDYCYNVVDRPLHVHDLNATILHCLGMDHEALTYRHQGRDFRLTDVHGQVAREILT